MVSIKWWHCGCPQKLTRRTPTGAADKGSIVKNHDNDDDAEDDDEEEEDEEEEAEEEESKQQ